MGHTASSLEIATAQALSAALLAQNSGRSAEAEHAYRSILARQPELAEALFLCGVLVLRRDAAEGVRLLKRCLAIRPGHTATKVSLADAYLRAGDAARAVHLYRDALQQRPGHVGAWINLSVALRQLRDSGGALAAARQAVCLAPVLAEAHAAHAAALLRQGDLAAAVRAADHALALAPQSVEAWFVRGTGLSGLGQTALAIGALQQALRLAPGHAQARLNLGNALADQDRLIEAAAECRAAIEADPKLVEAHTSLAFMLTALGCLPEAIAAADQAIALDSSFAVAHWNLGTAALLSGDFGRGFEKYEWRREHPLYRQDFHQLPGPVWQGDMLAGRRLLVLAEQGLGDTIQMARYLPLAAASGGPVVLACDARLRPLLSRLPGVQTVPSHADVAAHDVWIDQMSLPRLFATTPETVPAAGGYLGADPALVAEWTKRLPRGRTIGLVWAGNPGHSNDRRRSLPFALLSSLLDRPGCNWVSLQVGPARAAAASDPRLVDAGGLLTDFAQTAAAISSLDLVIAVDTSTAHLAGALGVPVWVMLPHAPDWRWLLSRPDDTPWYSSMRLFRQPAPGDWASVVARVATALDTSRSAFRDD